MGWSARGDGLESLPMIEAGVSHSVRVYTYRERVSDMSGTFRLPADVDTQAVLKRGCAGRHPQGWTMLVHCPANEVRKCIATLLNHPAVREMGGPGFAAALAATLDGGNAVLAASAKDGARVERLRSALGGTIR